MRRPVPSRSNYYARLHYTLATDPWDTRCGYTKPAYALGKRIGTAGCVFAFYHAPSFPSHSAAIDAARFGAYAVSRTAYPSLTAAAVMDFRASARAIVPDFRASASSASCRFNPECDGFELVVNGVVLGWARDLAVVAALMRAERWEPGFIGRVLDPAYVPDELALDADGREASRMRRADEAARLRQHQRDEEDRLREARFRAPAAIAAPADLSIDDLLSTL
ncbi:hypothetical protein Kuura_051 [Caulobacter phage Kuura]|nr:hypothetical protein Kuura_051 [Caulobacter phage Kuura]